MNHAHRVEGDAIVAADGHERISVRLSLDGVVADGVAAVGSALAPLLATGHNERGHPYRRAPRQTIVGRQGCIRPLPQGHGLAVTTVVVRGGLHAVDGVLESVEPVEPAILIYPLEGLQLVG